MANVILILGKSGTGKSTSIKTLDPKATVVINVLGKRLPFKGSNSLYNAENKNLFHVDSWDKVQQYVDSIGKNTRHVKNVIIEDATYIIRKEYFARAKEAGLVA